MGRIMTVVPARIEEAVVVVEVRVVADSNARAQVVLARVALVPLLPALLVSPPAPLGLPPVVGRAAERCTASGAVTEGKQGQTMWIRPGHEVPHHP